MWRMVLPCISSELWRQCWGSIRLQSIRLLAIGYLLDMTRLGDFESSTEPLSHSLLADSKTGREPTTQNFPSMYAVATLFSKVPEHHLTDCPRTQEAQDHAMALKNSHPDTTLAVLEQVQRRGSHQLNTP